MSEIGFVKRTMDIPEADIDQYYNAMTTHSIVDGKYVEEVNIDMEPHGLRAWIVYRRVYENMPSRAILAKHSWWIR